MINDLVKAAEALINSIQSDNGLGGGLITRETVRKSDELRILVLKWRKKNEHL